MRKRTAGKRSRRLRKVASIVAVSIRWTCGWTVSSRRNCIGQNETRHRERAEKFLLANRPARVLRWTRWLPAFVNPSVWSKRLENQPVSRPARAFKHTRNSMAIRSFAGRDRHRRGHRYFEIAGRLEPVRQWQGAVSDHARVVRSKRDAFPATWRYKIGRVTTNSDDNRFNVHVCVAEGIFLVIKCGNSQRDRRSRCLRTVDQWQRVAIRRCLSANSQPSISDDRRFAATIVIAVRIVEKRRRWCSGCNRQCSKCKPSGDHRDEKVTVRAHDLVG